MPPRTRPWLLVAAYVPYASDVALTLASQPSSYWRGHYDTADEANPLAWWVMLQGPEVSIAAAAVWAVALAAVVACGRPWLAVVVACAVALGHTAGSITWMARWDWPGYVAAVVLVVVVERLLSRAWKAGADASAPAGVATPGPR